jgi:hypothetical protein
MHSWALHLICIYFVCEIGSSAYTHVSYRQDTEGRQWFSLSIVYILPLFGGWSATESTIPEATAGLCTSPGWWCWWVWRSLWNVWQGKPTYSEKTFSSAAFSTTNHTWPNSGSNSGRPGGKPATNRLSYGTAIVYICLLCLLFSLPLNVKISCVCCLRVCRYCPSCMVTAAVTQEWQSRNNNVSFLIVESSAVCTGVEENLVQSLKRSAKHRYDPMPTYSLGPSINTRRGFSRVRSSLGNCTWL